MNDPGVGKVQWGPAFMDGLADTNVRLARLESTVTIVGLLVVALAMVELARRANP